MPIHNGAQSSSVIEKAAAMYCTHIDFEDSVLFPLARRVLSRSQAAEIAEEVRKHRNPSGRTAPDFLSRDPEDRAVNEQDPAQVREKMLDKTIADSFPASDPPSSNPAPEVDPFAA